MKRFSDVWGAVMLRFVFGALCLLMICSTAFGQSPKKYALLIAVTTYEHPFLNSPPNIKYPEQDAMKYPEADAQAIADLFEESGYQVDLLTGERATRKAVADALAGLSQQANQTGVIVVGFFGHGVEYDEKSSDGQLTSRSYFCPFDASMRKPLEDKDNRRSVVPGVPPIEPDPKTLISMSDVFKAISLSPAGNRLLLADCCYYEPQWPRSRGFGTSIKSGDLPKNVNMAVLLSCSKGENAEEDPISKHGAFAKCFIDWLKNPEGHSTGSHLGKHMELAVPKLVKEFYLGKRNQTPRYLTNNTFDLQLAVAEPSTSTPPTKPLTSSTATADGFAGRSTGEAKELSPGIKFRWCPAGTFTMGSPKSELSLRKKHLDNEDQVEVTLSQGFWLGETEVTQGEWEKLMGTTPWKGREDVKAGANHAASYISYDDAVRYGKKLTAQERLAGRLPNGWSYSLPTEAQWEYACRAGATTKYGFGESESDLGTYAWYTENAADVGESYPHAVGQKKPNLWGLKDMHGNVFEWCADWNGEKLPGGIDPVGVSEGVTRIYRGGSYFSPGLSCRSALRAREVAEHRNYDLGFRVAAVPSSK